MATAIPQVSSGRQNQSRLTLILDGRNLGEWHDKTGGDTDTNSVQYFMGGMGPRVSLGGQVQVANLVVSRIEDDELIAFSKWLIGRTGKALGTLSQQKMDDDNHPVGDPFVWAVKLKRTKPADVQSQSNNAAVFEIELEVNGLVA